MLYIQCTILFLFLSTFKIQCKEIILYPIMNEATFNSSTTTTTAVTNVVLIPINSSMNDILNIKLKQQSNGSVISWLPRRTTLLLREVANQYPFVDATRPDYFSRFSKMTYSKGINNILIALLRTHYLKRVALIVHLSDCNTDNIISLSQELQKSDIYSKTVCVDIYDGVTKDLWYNLEDIITLSMTTIVSFISPNNVISIVQIADSLNMLTSQYNWIFFNLNIEEELTLTYPTFQYNNVNIEQQLIATTSQLTTMLRHFDNNIHSLQKSIIDKSFVLNYVKYKLVDINQQKFNQTLLYGTKPTKKTFLRFASKIYPPLVKVIDIINENGYCMVGMPCRIPYKIGSLTLWLNKCCSGLILEILELVIKDMDIEYDLYMVEDNTFGGFVNGSWTGIINDVYTGKADVGVQALTTLSHRLDYIDFTVPILGSNLGIVRREETQSLQSINWVFLSHLELNLCFAIIIAFIANFGVVLLCENLVIRSLGKSRYPTREMFSYLAGLFFQRDIGGKNPTFWSSRIPSISYAIVMTIIMTTYTANLTASNIVYADNDDFKGLKDTKITNPTDKFVFTVMAKTSYELYMRRKNLYEFVKNNLVQADYFGVKNVIERKLDAYISDWTYLKFLMQIPEFCNKVNIYKETSVSIFSAFAVQKNSPWKESFSQEILNIFELKQMEALLNKWLHFTKCDVKQNEAEPFPLIYFGGLLVFSSSSIVFAIFILLIENCLYRIKKH